MIRTGIAGSGILAVCAGGFAAFTTIYAAWEHNPQQVFHSATHVNWAGLGLIGVAWFITVGFSVFILLAAGVLAVRGFRHWLESETEPRDSGRQ